jgi:hypothetical protein
VADDQSSSQSQHGDTSEFDKGSFNGVSICPVSAKEAIAIGKKRNKEKARVSQRS